MSERPLAEDEWWALREYIRDDWFVVSKRHWDELECVRVKVTVVDPTSKEEAPRE